ncbi:MAG: phasin family protein [Gammaproteobacteria bacterium]|nr:phasin family protein [Gammaproteobacteria bacterium]
MTTQTKSRARQTEPSELNPWAMMANYNGTAMAAYLEASRAFTNGLTALNSEVMSFATKRWGYDMNLSQSLTGCDNWAKASALQQNWAQQAMKDYAEEASRLMDMASAMTQDAWHPLYESSTEAVRGLDKEIQKTVAR